MLPMTTFIPKTTIMVLTTGMLKERHIGMMEYQGNS